MKTPEQMAEEFSNVFRSERKKTIAKKSWYTGFEEGLKYTSAKWISVKDRLPEYTPMVLAMCTDGYELAYYGMYGQGWTNTLGTEHLNVTHWHPLPAPPKEEK